MWAIIFVLSNGTTALLHVPDAVQQKHAQCLEYGNSVARVFNALSEDLKIISGQCWRQA